MPICPNCGQENPEGFRLCGMCGTPLQARAASGAEERKVVSVLFVDLVGFTASSDRADPEDIRARLRPYHEMLKRHIERYGGTVEKFIGDAVMAVFGAPVAHEDDAERAVRAALRITESIPELNEERPGLDLSVRAAVNTGEAVVSLSARPEQGEGIVAGDVVNTASRLQGVAPVGGVVVGEVTYRATRHVIDYERLEPVRVKGKEEPLPIWRAVAARSRFAVEVERPSAELIGREDDLALLRQTFQRTVRECSIQLVTVTGEPGVGKSRLVAEFFHYIDDLPDLVAWRQGRCLPYGEGVTFWALGEVIKAQAGVLESDTPDDAVAKLAHAVANDVEEASERDWITARLAPLVGTSIEGSSAAEREESFTAWRSFLEAVASRLPLVLVIEDLHWADDALLAFVEHVVDWSTGVPIMIVCTARPELYERHPEWGGGKRNSTTIGLSPLSQEETARLISALLEQAVLPAETQVALLDRAGGNPLYTEEFVRMLVDRGLLRRRGATWTVPTDAEIPVPESVQAIIAARLDTLAPERKTLLHDASVVGKTFWSGALAAMGGADEAGVRARLHELARKELVRPARRSSVAGQTEYSFWHVLVRDVAYGQIPRSARAAKHVAAAEWIEEMVGERVADHAELLAHHYLQALDLAAASSAPLDTETLASTAVRFLIIAGDRAVALDLEKALGHYSRALSLVSADDARRAAVLMKLADVTGLLGHLEDSARFGEEAVAAFRRRGDRVAEGEAMTVLQRTVWFQGEVSRSIAIAKEAVELLEREPPGPALGTAYGMLASRYGLAGRSEEALELAEKAIPICREFGMNVDLSRALQFRAWSKFFLGLGGWMEDARESVRLVLEAEHPSAAVALVNMAGLVCERDGPLAALDVYAEAIAFARRRGLSASVRWAKAETTWMLYDLGRWEEMAEIADEVLSADPERTLVSFIVLPYIALTRAWRGELSAAVGILDEILPQTEQIDDPQTALPTLTAAALVASRRGDWVGAQQLIEQFKEASAARRSESPKYLPILLRILVEGGRADVGERLLEGVPAPSRRVEYYLVSARAILAEGKGELDGAVSLYEEAAERWASFGNVLEHGQALLGAGRCLLALARSGEASSRLREARDRFVELRAAPLVEEADSLLERATALTS